MYAAYLEHSKNCIDCFNLQKSELCYECSDPEELFTCMYIRTSKALRGCLYCEYSVGCIDCIGCTNLFNKQNYFLNQPVSKDEIALIKIKLFSDASFQKSFKTNFDNLKRSSPRQNLFNISASESL